MYTFFARLKVASGREHELQAVLASVRDQMLRSEPGVIYYDFAISAEDASRYLVVEGYSDQAAQASHVQTAWVRESIPRTLALIDGSEVKQYVAPGVQPEAVDLPGAFA